VHRGRAAGDRCGRHRTPAATDPIRFGDHYRRPKSESADLVAHSRTGRREGGRGPGAARRGGRLSRASRDAHIHHEPAGRRRRNGPLPARR
jgi:hypothetical protein